MVYEYGGVSKVTLEIIQWEDAWQQSGSQKIRQKKARPVVTETVGWVVEENESGVLVTSERWPEYPDRAYGLGFIPHSMILSRCVISFETPETLPVV